MQDQSIERVPSARFDYRSFPISQRLEAFRAMTSDLYQVWPIGSEQDFAVDAIGYRLEDLIFSDVSFSPARFRRDGFHLNGAATDFFVLEAVLEGEQLLLMDHGLVQMQAGSIYLRDWSVPFESKASAMRLKSILIPRHYLKLSYAGCLPTPVVGWSTAEPTGRSLLTLWSSLSSDFPHAALREAENLAKAFLHFLDGVLCFDDAKTQAKLSDIQRFVLSQLQGNIQLTTLCDRFGVSRSTMYRLFTPLGGFHKYLTDARLQRCFMDLYRADPDRTNVGSVAASWGFNDASHFSRSFRKRFGMAPSSVLGAGILGDSRIEASETAGCAPQYAQYVRWFKFGQPKLGGEAEGEGSR